MPLLMSCSTPLFPPVCFCLRFLNVALLGSLLMPWIEKRVRDDGEQQYNALDEILAGVGDVHDRHSVEHRADQQRPDNDVEDAAATPRQPDAAQNHDEDHVVDE